MAGSKVFLSVLAALTFFNVIFYLQGSLNSIFEAGSILGIFLTVGGIAVILSSVPLTSASGTIKWFLCTLIVASILYSVTFNILGWDIGVGIGLVSNLTNLFPADSTTLFFLPWLFFTVLGLIGLISGVLAIGSGGE